MSSIGTCHLSSPPHVSFPLNSDNNSIGSDDDDTSSLNSVTVVNSSFSNNNVNGINTRFCYPFSPHFSVDLNVPNTTTAEPQYDQEEDNQSRKNQPNLSYPFDLNFPIKNLSVGMLPPSSASKFDPFNLSFTHHSHNNTHAFPLLTSCGEEDNIHHQVVPSSTDLFFSNNSNKSEAERAIDSFESSLSNNNNNIEPKKLRSSSNQQKSEHKDMAINLKTKRKYERKGKPPPIQTHITADASDFVNNYSSSSDSDHDSDSEDDFVKFKSNQSNRRVKSGFPLDSLINLKNASIETYSVLFKAEKQPFFNIPSPHNGKSKKHKKSKRAESKSDPFASVSESKDEDDSVPHSPIHSSAPPSVSFSNPKSHQMLHPLTKYEGIAIRFLVVVTEEGRCFTFVHGAELCHLIERKSNVSRFFSDYLSPSEKVLFHVKGNQNHSLGQMSNILTLDGVRRFSECPRLLNSQHKDYALWIKTMLIPQLQLIEQFKNVDCVSSKFLMVHLSDLSNKKIIHYNIASKKRISKNDSQSHDNNDNSNNNNNKAQQQSTITVL